MQSEIRSRGPILATFTIYADLYNYRSGIYERTSRRNMGGHAVKVVGWGSERGVFYWIAANSWGSRWGERGFFKIKFGEAGFGRVMYSCQADTR